MGRFKNLFIEKIPETIPDEVVDYNYGEGVEVSVENVTQENLIADIYMQNNLADATKSIFKVEELINSLPKEMPKETKRATVLSILSSFGLSIEEVINDGEDRLDVVRAALDNIVSTNKSKIAENDSMIEQKKIEIQELQKDNSLLENTIKNSTDKIVLEVRRIDELVEFLGGK